MSGSGRLPYGVYTAPPVHPYNINDDTDNVCLKAVYKAPPFHPDININNNDDPDKLCHLIPFTWKALGPWDSLQQTTS